MVNRILLTGAGFTHNFGAPIASGMWNLIFNNPVVQEEKQIIRLLRNNFDFEDVYYNVVHQIESEYSQEQKDILSKAVLDAYMEIDEIISQFEIHGDRQTRNDCLKFLINEFQNVFTLNQDCFLERYDLSRESNIILPCVNSKLLKKPNGEKFDPKKDFCEVGDNIESAIPKPGKNQRNYIKLHGSFDWIQNNSENIMVIGRDKKKQIHRHPLLCAYFDEFKKQVMQENTKLMIIGYGFGDKHINEILKKGVSESGLKIYIICPENAKDFFEKTLGEDKDKDKANVEIIRKGICGYFPCTLTDVFPQGKPSGSSLGWKKVEKCFFEN